jgi:hypothetical protein
VDLQETSFSDKSKQRKLLLFVSFGEEYDLQVLETKCLGKFWNLSRKKEGENLGYHVFRNSVVHGVLLG